MTATPSNMLPLGTVAPDFTLPNAVTDESLSLTQYAKGKPLVLVFMCNHCPFVRHILAKLAMLGNDYMKKGVAFITISSNDITHYPADAPDKMKTLANDYHFQFPYCYDETQSVAKAYDAACTPDFYVFNAKHQLVYRGQFDTARPGNNEPVTGANLTEAIDCVLADTTVNHKQLPSMGCNIKWKTA